MEHIREISTKYRRIISEIPHSASIPLIEELKSIEPSSMSGFMPVVWNRAEGFQVWDAYGNMWIDFTSSVVLANAGHADKRIGESICMQIGGKMWHNYCNPSKIRLRTVKKLLEILPPPLDRVFLLTTGSEAVECAIKLMRLHGRRINERKINILCFINSFHGRTMAAQMAGGFLEMQEWMGQKPGGFYHIPYPECARCPWGRREYDNCGKDCLEKGLELVRQQGVDEKLFAGVMAETFQGPFAAFMPDDYVKALREWASRNYALLVFDEIQAGFGRTGKWFGFEHYGVEPDLICMGKGMTSCLPMSAVAGRARILDIAQHGEMSSTHTGNPLCCAAAMANIDAISEGKLVENAEELGKIVRQSLMNIRRKYPRHVGVTSGKGLVWAVYLINPQTGELNPELGKNITSLCIERGLMMLQTGRGTLKIAPPLCINREALIEGIEVIEESIGDFTGE